MRIVAVLVTHRPDLAALEALLAALGPQVAGIVMVDDGSGAAIQAQIETLLARQPGPCEALMRPGHDGLAAAQNAGIAAARGQGAEAVLLMDQDSLPAPDMVAALWDALARRAGDRPAAVGPGYDEPHRGAGAGLPPGEEVPEMPALIASGCLIPLPVFETVGPFDESLFIDFVDTEWCFRARAAGYRLFATRAARMTHRIGDGGFRLGGRGRNVHPPARLYTQVRNPLLLARRRHVPRGWLWRTAPRMLVRGLVLSLARPPRRARAAATLRGLWHGLRGRAGPVDFT